MQIDATSDGYGDQELFSLSSVKVCSCLFLYLKIYWKKLIFYFQKMWNIQGEKSLAALNSAEINTDNHDFSHSDEDQEQEADDPPGSDSEEERKR